MLSEQPLLPSPSGFKRFFSIHPATPREGLAIRGLGVRERMPPGFIHRPGGTGDFLFMVFHDPVSVGKSRRDAVLSRPDTAMVWAPGMDQFYGSADARFQHSWLHASGPRLRTMIAAARFPLGRAVCRARRRSIPAMPFDPFPGTRLSVKTRFPYSRQRPGKLSPGNRPRPAGRSDPGESPARRAPQDRRRGLSPFAAAVGRKRRHAGDHVLRPLQKNLRPLPQGLSHPESAESCGASAARPEPEDWRNRRASRL